MNEKSLMTLKKELEIITESEILPLSEHIIIELITIFTSK